MSLHLEVEAAAAHDALDILDAIDLLDVRKHRLESLLRLLERRLVVVGAPLHAAHPDPQRISVVGATYDGACSLTRSLAAVLRARV